MLNVHIIIDNEKKKVFRVNRKGNENLGSTPRLGFDTKKDMFLSIGR